MKRRIKWIVILIVVGLMLFGIYNIARVVVRNSYSSLDVVKQEESDGETEMSKPDMEEREYLDDGSGSKLQRVSVLYDKEDVRERQRDYLGNDWGKFSGVLGDIEGKYTEVFGKLSEREVLKDYEIDETCVSGANDFNVNMLGSGKNIRINTSLTVVGLYGDACVVYANNYPEVETTELVVVDYSNALFNTDAREYMDFGDVCSLEIVDGSYMVDDSGELPVVYIKE